MAFSPQQILSLLPCHPNDKAVCLVAYSGGMDSHVLLDALCQLRDSGDFKGAFKAIHINHGLSQNADDWVSHCEAICADYAVDIEVHKVVVDKAGQGLESAARDARLAVFQSRLETGDYLLSAHHRDDQMETMLFRMMRGTGLRGLSAMPMKRSLGHGTLLRPLLDVARIDLKAYALQQGLTWIEDESNQELNFDRNYLRQQVMPLLDKRWPGFRKNWSRLAQLASEGEILQRELGIQDLAGVQEASYRLDIEALQKFSSLRQRNILRCWFLALEQKYDIPAPDYKMVEQIFEELIPAVEDASPLVSWEKKGQRVEIRRFASRIYLVLPQIADMPMEGISWDTNSPLELPAGLGQLSLIENGEEGVTINPGEKLRISFRQGGEEAKPAGRKTRPLKKILQDYQVPPWLRELTPIIFCNGEMLAVADLFICDQHLVKRSQANNKKMYKFQWLRSDLHCGY